MMGRVTKWIIFFLFLIMVATGAAGVYLIEQDGGFDRRTPIDENREIDLADASNIIVENNMADFIITFADVDTATATLSGKGFDEEYSFVTEKRNNGYYIKLYHQSGGILFDYSQFRLQLVLPESYSGGLAVQNALGSMEIAGHSFSSLEITASVGSITLGDMGAENIRLNASTGDIIVGALTGANEISLQSATGSITTGLLSAETVFIDSSTGQVMVEGMENATATLRNEMGEVALYNLKNVDLSLRSSTGNIAVSYLEFQNNLSVTASTGKIEVTLPADAAFRLDAQGGNGITTDFTLSEVETEESEVLLGYVGAGESDALVTLHSGTGKIRILAAANGE